MQQHEAARRMAEVAHLRDRLLAPVAALAEVHGAAQPVELVRDRLLVDLGREPRSPGGDAQRLRGERARDGDAPGRARQPAASASAARGTMRSIQCQSDAGWPASGAYWWPPGRAAAHGSTQSRATPFGSCAGAAASSADVGHRAEHARTRRVRSATSTRSMNRMRSRNAASGAASVALDEEPGGLAVVDDVHRVLDATGCVEEERLGRTRPERAGRAPGWPSSGASSAGRAR